MADKTCTCGQVAKGKIAGISVRFKRVNKEDKEWFWCLDCWNKAFENPVGIVPIKVVCKKCGVVVSDTVGLAHWADGEFEVINHQC